jgi:hypothetical protein
VAFVIIGALLYMAVQWFATKPDQASTAARNPGHRPSKLVAAAVISLGALPLPVIAFVLPIYTATSFGTWEQYLSVFVAGILGKVAFEGFAEQVGQAGR